MLYLPQVSELFVSRRDRALKEAISYNVDVVIDGSAVLSLANDFSPDYIRMEAERELLKAKKALEVLKDTQERFCWDLGSEIEEVERIQHELEKLAR